MPGWQRPISVSFIPASKRYGERGGEQAEIKAGISITAPVSCQEGAGTLQRRFLWGHASNASNQQVLDGSICIAAFFFSFFFSSVPGFIFPSSFPLHMYLASGGQTPLGTEHLLLLARLPHTCALPFLLFTIFLLVGFHSEFGICCFLSMRGPGPHNTSARKQEAAKKPELWRCKVQTNPTAMRC